MARRLAWRAVLIQTLHDLRGLVLHHLDALELLASLPSGSVDLLLTDPPYNTTNLVYDRRKFILEMFWPLAWRALKPSGVAVIFSAQPFTSRLVQSDENWWLELIWIKTRPTRFLDANHRPLQAHENIEIFCREKHRATYNPQKTIGKPYDKRVSANRAGAYGGMKENHAVSLGGSRYPLSYILMSSGDNINNIHPSQKPLELIEWLILTYSNPGDLVVDPYAGSATTGVACHILGRRFEGSEIDAAYFETARKRLEEAERQKVLI